MQFNKKIIGYAGLITLGLAGVIYGFIYLDDFYRQKREREEELFLRNESAIVRQIEHTSPFSQKPVKVAMPSRDIERRWYHSFPFIYINNEDIAYVKGNEMYLARNREETASTKIAKDINLHGRNLFAVNIVGNNNTDIYWINWNKEVRKLKDNNRVFSDEGVVLDLKDKFNYLPEHIAIGDVTADNFIDIIFEDTIQVGDRNRRAIKALFGDKSSKLSDKGISALYYLGDEWLDGIISKDVDNDGDSDLVFKLSGNNSEFFGLENLTKIPNITTFKVDLEKELSSQDENTALSLFVIWYFFLGGDKVLNPNAPKMPHQMNW